jgi:hypothetical protein
VVPGGRLATPTVVASQAKQSLVTVLEMVELVQRLLPLESFRWKDCRPTSRGRNDTKCLRAYGYLVLIMEKYGYDII